MAEQPGRAAVRSATSVVRRLTKNQAAPWGWGGLRWRSPPGRRENSRYKDGGAGFVLAAGCCAGVEPSTVLVIRRTSTRRFFARPSLVLLSSTGLSLPSPTR